MDEIGRIITDINEKNHFDNLSKIVENANMSDLLKNPIVMTLIKKTHFLFKNLLVYTEKTELMRKTLSYTANMVVYLDDDDKENFEINANNLLLCINNAKKVFKELDEVDWDSLKYPSKNMVPE